MSGVQKEWRCSNQGQVRERCACPVCELTIIAEMRILFMVVK
jgi:hypothetical protein